MSNTVASQTNYSLAAHLKAPVFVGGKPVVHSAFSAWSLKARQKNIKKREENRGNNLPSYELLSSSLTVVACFSLDVSAPLFSDEVSSLPPRPFSAPPSGAGACSAAAGALGSSEV